MAGRLIAVVLMVVGIGLVGVVTGAVAAWFISSVKEPHGQPPERQGNSA